MRKQQTITRHVNHTKSSHEDPTDNDKLLKWLQNKYGSDELGSVKATRGKRHQYLGMKLDYSTLKTLKLDTSEYIKRMI
jgi:hypothetical protein